MRGGRGGRKGESEGHDKGNQGEAEVAEGRYEGTRMRGRNAVRGERGECGDKGTWLCGLKVPRRGIKGVRWKGA